MKKRAVSRPASINLEREGKTLLRLQERATKRFIADVVEIGKHLAKVKDGVDHGEFLTWLGKYFRGSVATAERAMAVAKLPAKIVNVTNLDLTVAYVLARQPPEVVEEIYQRLESGETITRKTFKVIKSPTTERSYKTIVGYTTEPSATQGATPSASGMPTWPSLSPPSQPSPEPSQPSSEPQSESAEGLAAATALFEVLDAVEFPLPDMDVLAEAYCVKQPKVSADEIHEIGCALVGLAEKLKTADATPAGPPPEGTRH
jgi:hypothetical protein